MTRFSKKCRDSSPVAGRTGLDGDRRGSVTLEWSLLFAAVGLPLVAIMAQALDVLAGYYRFISLMISLPFP